MRIDPPFRDARHFPLTVIVGVAAMAVSGAWWMGQPVDPLILEPGRIASQPWALLTSILPHVDPLHLIFNLYWWWRFATRIESAWGRGALLGVTVLLAVASNAAEYVLSDAGVGLSGVVYGLCTLLFVVRRHDQRLAGIVDQRTLQFFAAWFVLCVVLTYVGIWRVGNVAHGAGALAGWLLGAAIASHGRERAVRAAALGGVLVLLAGAAVFGESRFNVLASGAGRLRAGYWAIHDGRFGEAERLFAKVVKDDPANAAAWQNLARAQSEQKKHAAALGSCLRAISGDEALKGTLQAHVIYTLQMTANESKQPNEVERLSAEVVREYPEDAEAWFVRGVALQRVAQYRYALDAYEHVISLDPTRRSALVPAMVSILQSLAYAAARSGDNVGALRLVDEALTWNPEDEYSGKLRASILSRPVGVPSPQSAPAISPPGGP